MNFLGARCGELAILRRQMFLSDAQGVSMAGDSPSRDFQEAPDDTQATSGGVSESQYSDSSFNDTYFEMRSANSSTSDAVLPELTFEEEEESETEQGEQAEQTEDASEQTEEAAAEQAEQPRPEVTVDKNEDGSVSAVHIKVPGQEGEVTLTRNEGGGWSVNPPGAEVPGFKTLKQSEDGTVLGDFSITDAGTVGYESERGVKEYLKTDGTREIRNNNDYSRIREVDGQEVKEYWDGYEYRQAADVQTADGKTVVTFAPEEGKPTSIERDPATDSLKVDFASGLSYDANWRNQQIARNDGKGNTTTLFNTGNKDAAGNTVWKEGTITHDDGNQYIVEFAADASAQSSCQGGQCSTADAPQPERVRVTRGNESADAEVEQLDEEQASEDQAPPSAEEQAQAQLEQTARESGFASVEEYMAWLEQAFASVPQ